MSVIQDVISPSEPAWRLQWLTPVRCRLILAIVLALGFLAHVYYLNHNCPIDLSGDEAQYWDWSRHLDLSYYSKGPLIAYIIRASCTIFGNTMPAVRYPALVLSVATSVVTYLLTRKLFGSEKLALGTVLLFHMVPMFIAGSLLMTIDPPMFFCWALAAYFAATAIFDGRKSMWIAVGVAVGFGFLAKYAVFLWFLGLFGFLLTNKRVRDFKFAILSVVVAALFAIPVIAWNVQHDWVSFRHVARQTGASQGAFQILNVVELLASLIALVGPTLAYLMVAAIAYSSFSLPWYSGGGSGWGFVFNRKSERPHPSPPPEYQGRESEKLSMLIWIGTTYLALNLLASLRAKVQANWPAPGFFTLLILTAYFLGNRLQSIQTWKPWRGWFRASIVIALIVILVAHDTSVLFPIVKPFVSEKFDMSRIDALERLRGWSSLGTYVSEQLKAMPPDTFILCSDYQQTAEVAFYADGQPTTYCSGLYAGKRMSQYDIWPDRRLGVDSPLVGHDAIFVGKGGPLPDEISAAFDHVEKLPILPVVVRGVEVKSFKTWRCFGFKGFPTPSESRDY